MNDTTKPAGGTKSVGSTKVNFLWVEFLDPGDGISMAAHAARYPVMRNLLLDAFRDGTDLGETRLPIPKADRGSMGKVHASKGFPHLRIYEVTYSQGLKGLVSYPDAEVKSIGTNWFHAPTLAFGSETRTPHIYVLSGHGATGIVFGEDPGVHPDEPSPEPRIRIGSVSLGQVGYQGLRVLIVPACSQVAYYRGLDWQQVFGRCKIFAVLGYARAYSGGGTGVEVMAKFVRHLCGDKLTFLEAWKNANSNQPWGAYFLKGTEGHKLIDVLKPDPPSISRSGDLMHYSAINKGVPYRIPPLMAAFVRPENNDPKNLSRANEYKTSSFEDVFKRVSSSRHLVKTGADVWFCMKNTGASDTFRKGDILYFRFYMFRPDHDNTFDIQGIFQELEDPKHKDVPDAFGNGVMNLRFGKRLDVVRVVVEKDATCLAFPLKFKLDSWDYMQTVYDIEEPAVSFSCLRAADGISPKIVDDQATWCGNKAIDLRLFAHFLVKPHK